VNAGEGAIATVTRSSERERVERGAALLSERRPDWYWNVNLSDLDIQSLKRCVLGQLYGGYNVGLSELNLRAYNEDRHHGFDAYAENYSREALLVLTDEWCRVITELRAANP